MRPTNGSSWNIPNKWVSTTILCLGLSACGGGGGGETGNGGGSGGGGTQVTLSPSVYPLATGDRRSWRTTEGPLTGIERHDLVGDAIELPSGEALLVRGATFSRGVEAEYLRRTATGVVSVPGPQSDPLTAAVGPLEILRFGAALGEAIVLADRSFNTDLDFDGRADAVDLRAESTFIGSETVITPAGTFANAAHVRTVIRTAVQFADGTSVTLTLTADDWYADGIGPVRTRLLTTAPGVPAETDAEDLIAFGVGERRSDQTSPVLKLSVPSAESLAQPDTLLDLTFNKPLHPLSIEGESGLVLVDAAGQQVATTLVLEDPQGMSLRLQQAAPLADGRYEIRNGGGATDLSGNPVATTVLSFVVDTTGPRLLRSTPADGEAMAPVAGPIRLSYDEPLFLSGGDFRLRIEDLNGSVEQSLAARLEGNDIVADLVTPLTRNTEYRVFIDNGPLDGAGNPLVFRNPVIQFRTDPGPLSRPETLVPDAEVEFVKVADIDGDGRQDLVFLARDASGSFLGAKVQQQDGQFSETVQLITAAPGSAASCGGFAVSDVDADGQPDIVTLGCFSQTLVLYRNLGEGRFDRSDAPTDIFSRVEGIDFDRDGRGDVVGFALNEFQFLRRDSAGQWSTMLTVPAGTPFVNDWRLVDVNGDQQADLIWLHNEPDDTCCQLAWALREGNGFGAVQRQAIPLTGIDRTPQIAVGEFTGEGQPDVAVVKSAFDRSDEVLLLRQLPGGIFAAPIAYPTAPAPYVAAVGDMDGDGKDDLVVGHSASRTVGIWLQDSGGTFQAERLFETTFGNYSDRSLALLDLNADGALDIVLSDAVLLSRPFADVWPLQSPGDTRAKAQGGASAPGLAGTVDQRASASTAGRRWLAAAQARIADRR